MRYGAAIGGNRPRNTAARPAAALAHAVATAAMTSTPAIARFAKPKTAGGRIANINPEWSVSPSIDRRQRAIL